ncbi:tetratricopeptide repeat protein [Micromonospora parva]|uniref:tetratricopeptide repeat protein n=1 Tax=Micromonospora parva TaxID=1464048 RepID=UPI0033C895F4
MVLHVGGQQVAEVPIPSSLAAAERLLFGPALDVNSMLVGSWLRPDAGVVESEPRREVDVLVDWCLSGQGPLVRLVCGTGGQGKTHLAGRVCERLRAQGWLAGSVRLPSPNWRAVRLADLTDGGTAGQRARRELHRVPEITAAVRAAARLRAPMLLVVDYAENVGPVVAELLDTIAEAGAAQWVRLLLLARTDADWFRELAVDHPLHDWVHPTPLRLGALSVGWDADRVRQVWAQAIDRFTERARQHGFGVSAGAAPVMRPGQRFPTTLDLYATALLAVLDAAEGQGRGDPGDRDALAGVLRHEQRQVSAALRASGLRLDEAGQAWALAAVTLTAPATEAEAVEVVARVRALDGMGDRSRLVRVLCRLYPDGSRERVWLAPTPDRLTDVHLLDLAGASASRGQWVDDLTALCGTEDGRAAGHATIVLHRCLSTPDSAGLRRDALALVRDGLAALVSRFPAGFVPALVVVDPAGFDAEIISAVTSSGGEPGLSVERVMELDLLLYQLGFATTRTGIAVAVSRRLVAITSPSAAESDPRVLNRYAGELNNLSVRLGEMGRRDEGLAASDEATAIYRRLVETNPAAYLPSLAMSLNNLSVRLGEVGRRDEGLAAIEEATTVHRRLVETNPAAYLPSLATSLNNLAVDLGEMGRHDEGLAAIEEATTIRRQLAAANPAAYLPDLAMSLNNLSIRMSAVDRHDKALAATEEATTIRRRLAAANRAAYLPDLATSLNNLSVDLGEMGRHDEGLAAIEEATAIHRQLAKANPAAYLPNLATSLNNLAFRMDAMGRHNEGLAAIEEATAIRRRLAAANPAAHLPDLAMSLNNLSVDLGEMGRHNEGLAAIEEATAIHRQLAKANPAAHLPNLATSLNNLANLLKASGRADAAEAIAREAARLSH